MLSKQTVDDLSKLLNSDNNCEYTDVTDRRIKPISASNTSLFNFLHLNIRSLVRNKDSLIALLKELYAHGVVVHVIGLCETFLNNVNINLSYIENYTAVHRIRKDKTGGGITLLIHDSVKLVKTIYYFLNKKINLLIC